MHVRSPSGGGGGRRQGQARGPEHAAWIESPIRRELEQDVQNVVTRSSDARRRSTST